MPGIQALSQARSRPVAVVGLSDSNGEFGGIGWKYGLARSLGRHYGMYASSIFNQEIAGTASSGGWSVNAEPDARNSTTSGLPAELEKFKLPSNKPYAYQGSGPIGSDSGLAIAHVDGGLDTSGHLIMRAAYGVFPGGSGSFQPGARRQDTFATLLSGDTISSVGPYGRTIARVLDLPAGDRAFPLEFKWTLPGGTKDSVAPNVIYWMQAENLLVGTGVSLTSLYAVPGASNRDAAAWLLAEPVAGLVEFFRAVRISHIERGLAPSVVIWTCFGLNNRNITASPSLGPNPSTDAQSAAAYRDNLDAIATRLVAVWQAGGWDPLELHFIDMVSHPLSDPDDAKLMGYRQASTAWAAGRGDASTIDITSVITGPQIQSKGWYDPGDGGGPSAHLKAPDGYVGVSDLIIARYFPN